MKKRLYVFDFDGTLTTGDTLPEFVIYAKGMPVFLWGLLLQAPFLLLMKLRLYPNYKAKQRFFAHFFRGMSLSRFDSLCRRFAEDSRDRLLRSKGREQMRQAMNSGADVFIVSASIANWVKPFFTSIVADAKLSGKGRFEVIGTQPETCDGILTGRFSSPNCYGPEKVRRIKEMLRGDRSQYEIIAFGDSRGDKEMLEYADRGHFRPFRP